MARLQLFCTFVNAVQCLAEKTKHCPRKCWGILTKCRATLCSSMSEDCEQEPQQIRSMHYFPVNIEKSHRREQRGSVRIIDLVHTLFKFAVCLISMYISEQSNLPLNVHIYYLFLHSTPTRVVVHPFSTACTPTVRLRLLLLCEACVHVSV